MIHFLLIAIIGFAAQLIDGALGMAYGATSATLLLTAGATPAIASATVHMAEVGTTFVAGVAHWKFGNVNWRLVFPLAIPGAIAAFFGALVLTSIPGHEIKPYVAGFLLLLGLYVLLRFGLRKVAERERSRRPLPRPLLVPLGGVAGFLDAVGGGGWGPITTTSLVASERVEPRKAIGSVDTAEFLVALAASIGFLIGLANEAVSMAWVGALLVGGIFAAPIAAWLVRSLNTRVLGIGVGAVLILTNARTLLSELGVSSVDRAMPVVYVAIALAMLVAVAFTLARRLRTATA